jgi:hypothetical protein
MNSYSGQIQPLSSLLGRSAPLNTIGPSELLPGPSGLLYQRVRGRPMTTVVPAWQIGDPGRGRTVRASARTVRPLREQSGFPCRTVRGHTRTTTWRPDNGERNRSVRIYHRTNRIRICRTCCCTPCTKLLHTTEYVSPSTYLNHNTPYNHRPINTIDRSRQEGRYTNARPNEPHSLGSGGLPLGAMEKIREEMTELFQDKFGVSVARVDQSYQKSYNHRFDTVTYPQGARIPEFSKFSGENGRSTHEHIGQFLAHLGELADGEAFRVPLFSLSLTGTAFAWYAALPPNSINSWNELESKFHEHFFAGEYELGLADLASVHQGREESVNDYIRRFRDTRNRCFRIHVADKELAGLAFNGLISYLRDKLDVTQFFSVAQLHQRALACENRFKEASKSAARLYI